MLYRESKPSFRRPTPVIIWYNGNLRVVTLFLYCRSVVPSATLKIKKFNGKNHAES